MYYVVELSKRAIVADCRGTRCWDIVETLAQNKAMALQQNNPTMQFAVVPVSNEGNSALSTLCVVRGNPLKIA